MLTIIVLLAALRFGPEVPLAKIGYTGHPVVSLTGHAVATDGRDHLVAWGGAGGVMVTRFTADGKVLDVRVVVARPKYAWIYDLIWTGRSYMLLIEAEAGLEVLTLASDGTVLTDRKLPEVPVLSWAKHFSLASNGKNALLFGATGDAKVRLLSLDGDLIATVPVAPLVPSTSPAVAAAGDGYLLFSPSYGLTTQAVSGDGRAGEPVVIGSASGPEPMIGNGSPLEPVVASDGERFLVAWPTFDGRLMARLVSRDNVPIGDAVAIAPDVLIPPSQSLYLRNLSLAWTGSEYVATFHRYGGSVTGMVAVPISRDLRTQGAPRLLRPSPEISWEASISARGDGRGMFVWYGQNGGLHAAPFDAATLRAREPLDVVFPITRGPRDQQAPAAVSNGRAVYAAWLERIQRGSDALMLTRVGGEPVTVATDVRGEFAVAIDGDTLWVVWRTEPQDLFAQRFDSALQPIDLAPVFVGTKAWITNVFPRLAAAGGAAVLVHEGDSARGGTSDRDPVVRYLDAASGTIRSSLVPIPFTPYVEIEGMVATSGSHFVVSWIAYVEDQKMAGDVPDDEIRAVRIARDGTLLDPTPFLVRERADTGSLRIVSAPDGVLAAWTRRYSQQSPQASRLRGTTPSPRRALPMRESDWLVDVGRHSSGFLIYSVPVSEIYTWPRPWTLRWTRTDADLQPVAEGILRLEEPVYSVAVASAGDNPVVVYNCEVLDEHGIPFIRLFYRETTLAPERRRASR